MRGKAPVRQFALSEKNIASVVKMSEYRRCSRSPLSIFLLRYHKDIQQEKEERGSLLVARDEAFGAPFSSVTRSENGFPPRYQTAAVVDGVLVFVFLPLSSRKDNSF